LAFQSSVSADHSHATIPHCCARLSGVTSRTGTRPRDRPDTSRVDAGYGQEIAHLQLETEGALGDPGDDLCSLR
jgi:hypothetical protein